MLTRSNLDNNIVPNISIIDVYIVPDCATAANDGIRHECAFSYFRVFSYRHVPFQNTFPILQIGCYGNTKIKKRKGYCILGQGDTGLFINIVT